MEKFEFIFNTNSLFENDENCFSFEESRINLYKKENDDKMLSELGIVINEEREDRAMKLAYLKAEELNDFFIFKKNISLIESPLKHKKIKFLDRKTHTVTKEFSLRYDIINKVSFNKLLGDYEKYKSIRKVISLYSDAEKVYDKELKFLAYYKALEFKNKRTDDWLEKRGEIKISSSKRKEKITELTAIRNNICHPCGKNIEITKKHLDKIKRFAREWIKESISN